MPVVCYDISEFISSIHDFNIAAISETHLDNKIDDNSVDIPGYTIFRKDRNRHGGGVALYIDNIIYSTRRLDLEINGLELVWVEYHLNSKKHLIGCCYRPPGQSAAEIELFINNLYTSLNLSYMDNFSSIMLLGDFNDRCRSWDLPHTDSELGNKLLNLTKSLNFSQLIRDATRGPNILDLIFTDSPSFVLDSGVLSPHFDIDHDVIHCTFKQSYTKCGSFTRRIFFYERGDFLSLNNHFNSIDWDMSGDIDADVNNITNIILDGINKFVPNRVIKVRRKDKPGITPHVRKLLLESKHLHKIKTSTGHITDIYRFKNKRREAKEALKIAKDKYYANLINKIQSPETTTKTYWKLVKSVYGPKLDSGIPSLLENGNVITNDRDKANLLNDYFVSQTILPPSTIPIPEFEYLTDSRLGQININPTKIKNILLNLDITKASGSDQISNRILKSCASSLCIPLSNFFNKSLEQGIFPAIWKEALVTAIFKKNNRQLKENYRPISLLSCISKVFERAVFMDLYPYFTLNNILSSSNSGFKKNDSAINRLLIILDQIYRGIDSHKEVLMILLDISKAFDRVWHSGLLFKLKQYGIQEPLLSWFRSYLYNRSQKVVVNGQQSDSKFLHSGVPQGSILGPLFFLIYINDMSNDLKSSCHQFADDTSLIKYVDDPVISIKDINDDLKTLANWANTWRVTFNANKTNFIRFSLKKKKPDLSPIYLNNTPISEVNTATNLGITLSNNLSWDNHVDKICIKAGKISLYSTKNGS